MGMPKAKTVRAPAVPAPIALPAAISEEARRAGGAERRRLRGRRGRAATIFAGARRMAPAAIGKAGLKTKLG